MRATMLAAGAHSAGELATISGVTTTTASGHLTRLRDGGPIIARGVVMLENRSALVTDRGRAYLRTIAVELVHDRDFARSAAPVSTRVSDAFISPTFWVRVLLKQRLTDHWTRRISGSHALTITPRGHRQLEHQRGIGPIRHER
jgi:hypothetical protein